MKENELLPIGRIDLRVGEETSIDGFSNIFNLVDEFREEIGRRIHTDWRTILHCNHLVVHQIRSMNLDA